MPPGRPIVSDTNSVSRKSADLVECFLAPLAKLTPTYVRDSLHVVSILKDVVVPDDVILFTMDINSLYTNIPIEDGLAAVSRAFLKHQDPRRPDLTILSILRTLLTSNDFVFRKERFLQIKGVAMGSAFGASLANIYLIEWEEKVLKTSPKVPMLWIRYIDDIFGIWPHSLNDLKLFCTYVNSIYPSISVTLTSSCNSIRFLDLELYISNNRLCHCIGFKPTDSFNILPHTSFHPPHVFKSILYGEIYRWCTRSSTYENFKTTKSIVQPHWRRQGYSRVEIRSAVKKVLKLTCQSPSEWSTGFYPCKCSVCKYGVHVHSVKDGFNSFPIVHRLTCSTCGIIYLITCKKCGSRYVGETARSLRQRISEHLNNIRIRFDSSVSVHFNDLCDLTDFSFTALEHCVDTTKRKKKEIVWIKRLQTLPPSGLNIVTDRAKSLHLIVPFSECSGKIIRHCQSNIQDANICGSYRMNKNLRAALRVNI